MANPPTAIEQDRAWALLMVAAQAGDGAAYDKLLRGVTPFIRALARRHCRNPADLEELLQDTLLTLHRVRHTYDPGRPFSPWLAAIASRRSIDGLRRRLRQARYEVADSAAHETFVDLAANNDVEHLRSAEEVGDLLRLLPARQRQALEALKLKEMSLAEASVASGQSVGALKVNSHRALKALRALFQQREEP
ncbi:MAG TPA: sigma-70 family RNA polymerase sigma factor [Steroidobacteraceae bacterium]|nr:sigma-70 family RNA polymerase sigma factor [Steroidobacteraceae bacterium]